MFARTFVLYLSPLEPSEFRKQKLACACSLSLFLIDLITSVVSRRNDKEVDWNWAARNINANQAMLLYSLMQVCEEYVGMCRGVENSDRIKIESNNYYGLWIFVFFAPNSDLIFGQHIIRLKFRFKVCVIEKKKNCNSRAILYIILKWTI